VGDFVVRGTVGILLQRAWRSTRTVRRAPLFSALVLLTIVGAVGANLVVFVFVRSLWLQPSLIADRGRVVVVARDVAYGPNGVGDMLTDEELRDLRAAGVFDGVAGQVNDSGVTGDFRPRVQFETVVRPMEALAVTANYFSLLGVPVRGRDFTVADDAPTVPAIAIISDRLWREEFSAEPDVIGRSVPTAYETVTIVGIAPPGFRGARLGEQVDVWIPRQLSWRMSTRARAGFVPRRMPSVVALARLSPGVDLAQASRAVDPPGPVDYQFLPVSTAVGVPGRVTAPLQEHDLLELAVAMAALISLAGCATLATLVLVRVERRRRELTVRLALGCSRTGLARLVLGEMVLLVALGVTAALSLARWVLDTSRSLSLPGGLGLDRIDLSLGWQSLLIAPTIAAASTLAAVLVALHRLGRRTAMAGLLGSSVTPAASSLRLQSRLLAVQAASTVVMLIGAALFVRTVTFAFAHGAGFDVDRTVFVSVQPSYLDFLGSATPSFGEERRAREAAAYERLRAELGSMPGVQAAALGEAPIRTGGMGSVVPDGPVALPMTLASGRDLLVGLHRGGAGYLEALGLPLLAGHLPDRQDAVLITRALADAIAPAGDPIGQFLRSGELSYQIVGIVPDFIQGSMSTRAIGGVVPLSLTAESFGLSGVSVVVRTASDAGTAVPRIARTVNRVFPLTARSRVVSGRELLTADIGRQRLGASFFSGFGIVALVLGVSAMFGLAAYLVEARFREFGIRLALGANTRSLLLGVVRTTLVPVVVGTAIGLLAAAGLSGAVEALVFGINAVDAPSYVGAAGLVTGSALLAGLAAGRQLRHVPPTAWLRRDI
jgi:putative ABC transport system permease protein